MERLLDNSVRAKLAILSLAIQSVISLMMAALYFYAIGSNASLISLSIMDVILSVMNLISFIGAAVAIIMWLYRAAVNLEKVPYHGMRYTSGWAIGGWFIPVANLFIPPGVVSGVMGGFDKLYSIISSGKAERSTSSGLITGWWGLYLLGAIVARVGPLLVANNFDGTYFKKVLMCLALSELMHIGSAIFLILLIRKIMIWEASSLELYRSGRAVAVPKDSVQRNAATPPPAAQQPPVNPDKPFGDTRYDEPPAQG